MLGRNSFCKISNKHYDCQAVVVSFRPYRIDEYIEYFSTLPAAAVYDRHPATIVRSLVTWQPVPFWTGKPLRME
jgi:hypothetical protein